MSRQQSQATKPAQSEKGLRPAFNLSVSIAKRDKDGKPVFDDEGKAVSKLFRCGALWSRKNGEQGFTGTYTNTVTGIDERVVVLPNESDNQRAPNWDFFIEHVSGSEDDQRKELIKVGSFWDHDGEGFSGPVKVPFTGSEIRLVALPPKDATDD